MTDEILRRILEEKRAEKARAALEAETRMNAAFSVPAISDAQGAYVTALHKCLMRGRQPDEKIKTLHDEYIAALAAYGYREDDFVPKANCALCGDTGIADGRPCECVRKKFIHELGIACDVDTNGLLCADFDPSSISDKAQAERLAKAYAVMDRYTSGYPSVTRRIIVFSGKTGTGKTYLAAAAARGMVLRGYSAITLSAMNFNNLMLKCHTSPYEERESILHDVLTVDMLIIDDLGTEPRYKNVTCEYLLLVLEERSSAKLSTVITTNLSADDIMREYNERIYSRLCDRRGALFIEFGGADLRLQ